MDTPPSHGNVNDVWESWAPGPIPLAAVGFLPTRLVSIVATLPPQIYRLKINNSLLPPIAPFSVTISSEAVFSNYRPIFTEFRPASSNKRASSDLTAAKAARLAPSSTSSVSHKRGCTTTARSVCAYDERPFKILRSNSKVANSPGPQSRKLRRSVSPKDPLAQRRNPHNPSASSQDRTPSFSLSSPATMASREFPQNNESEGNHTTDAQHQEKSASGSDSNVSGRVINSTPMKISPAPPELSLGHDNDREGDQRPPGGPTTTSSEEAPGTQRMTSLQLPQLKTHPLTEEQLVNEVRGIYAGLVMVEKKCIEIDKQQAESKNKLSDHQWQALISLHRTLLHEHHDFFLASQHPSASPVLKKLSEKYAMPARMWRYGIHSFLELLRHRLPDSLEHTLTFLYLAYSMMTLLLESVPAFEDTWIECLGDLARYRMAVEESDLRDRETWAGVARYWYHQAADKNPNVGRIQHHLAVLARPDMLQQLFYYTKSLVSLHPFPSAGESIQLLFHPLLNGPKPYNQPVVASAFVAAHGNLFSQGPLPDLKMLVNEYLLHLNKYIGRLGNSFKLHGVYMASCNFAAISQYGVADAVIPVEFKEQQQDESMTASENWTSVDDLNAIEAEFCEFQDSQSQKTVYYGTHLAFKTLSAFLDQTGNKNVFPAVHAYLAFSWCMARNNTSVKHIEVAVPWSKLATFLNAMLRSNTDLRVLERAEFPVAEDRKCFPEDFLLRGQVWSQGYFPADHFKDAWAEDEGRTIEVPSLSMARMYRCLWLGVRLAMVGLFVLD